MITGLHFRLDLPLLHRAEQAGHLRVSGLQLHQRLDHVQGRHLRETGRPVMDSKADLNLHSKLHHLNKRAQIREFIAFIFLHLEKS